MSNETGSKPLNVYDLYSTWVRRCELGPIEAARILEHAIAGGDRALAGSLLSARHCRPELIERARTCGVPAVIAAWVAKNSDGDNTAEAATWLRTYYDVGTLRGVVANLDPSRLRPEWREGLWETGDTTIRLRVLEGLGWGDRVPASWKAWLVDSHPFDDAAGNAKSHWAALGRTSSALAWDAATELGDVAVKGWVFSAMPDHEQRWRIHPLAEAVEAHLAANPGDTALLNDLANVVITLLETSKSGNVGTDLVAIARDLLGRLAPGVYRMDLEAALGVNDESDTLPPTHDELVATLQAGILHPAAIKTVAADPSDRLAAPVCSHPELNPIDGARIAAGPGRGCDLGDLLEGRDLTWRRQFADALWQQLAGPDPKVRAALASLDPCTAADVVTAWVTDKPSCIKRVLALDAGHSWTAVEALPVSAVNSDDYQLARVVHGVTRFRLGTDPAVWVMFEEMAPVYEGTYGELLSAARALAVPSTR